VSPIDVNPADKPTIDLALKTLSIAVVGGGNMGCALIRGWRAAEISAAQISVVEPYYPARCLEAGASCVVAKIEDLSSQDIIVLAIKPQALSALGSSLPHLLKPNTLVISILAGTRLDKLAASLNGHRFVVRAMPNTPAAIGQGVSVCIALQAVSPEQRSLANTLLSAVGAVHWLEDETLMDGVTGLSGSGPAYIFHMVEAMAQAGINVGLPEALAQELARATLIGSAALLNTSALSPQSLREQVTSPNGTTMAGLDVLMPALPSLMHACIAAATERSKALSQS
jgi:pyrroline-5-carboxylate reductase